MLFAVSEINTGSHKDETLILGVFDSPQLAWDCLTNAIKSYITFSDEEKDYYYNRINEYRTFTRINAREEYGKQWVVETLQLNRDYTKNY